MCFFVIICLYSAMSLTLVREQRFIRIMMMMIMMMIKKKKRKKKKVLQSNTNENVFGKTKIKTTSSK